MSRFLQCCKERKSLSTRRTGGSVVQRSHLLASVYPRRGIRHTNHNCDFTVLTPTTHIKLQAFIGLVNQLALGPMLLPDSRHLFAHYLAPKIILMDSRAWPSHYPQPTTIPGWGCCAVVSGSLSHPVCG